MASSNLNYSASKYTNNSNLKQTVSFPVYNSKLQNDDLKAKNWNLNQMRMNQSLNEFMKSINKSPNKSTTDPNLDITNLDDDESMVYSSKANNSIQRFLSKNESLTENGDVLASNEDINNTTLNSNSTTAEFKKYLEDLKKNYLEKLTFSCPSKLATSASSSFEKYNHKINNTNLKLKSVENINNFITRNTPVTSLANQQSHTRRSLFFDSKINEENSFDDEKQIKNMFFQNKITPINDKPLDEEIKSDEMFETPELTKTQILSRLVQIREYLKQAYAMLSTLQTSNDLVNYASQMNKLHSLIDHLKAQEKGYLDLLNSFSKFQQLTSNLYPIENDLNNSNINQKDILDLTDLNESVQQQHKQQQNQHNQILKEHANYLNNLMSSTSSNKSVAVQTSLNNPNEINNSMILNKKHTKEENEESIANSLSGSFISDTLTLNGVNCEMNSLYKYNKINKNKSIDLEKNDNLNDLIVIGKGYNQVKNEDDENKTENDLDLLEYEDEDDKDEKDTNELDSLNIKEQRKEILSALDSDMITLEQLKEQKKLLKSIRLRKEELKALEGRRKALEALRQIAMDSENQIDKAFSKTGNKSNNNEIDSDEFEDSKISNKQSLMRKTFKHSDNQNNQKLKKCNQSDDENQSFISIKSSIKGETLSQIEKTKKNVKHYEDLIKKKTESINSFQNSLLKTVSMPANYLNDDQNEDNDQMESKKNESSEELKQELDKKITDLAENEKKLEELYSMQSRLAQLKEIIVDFNGFKTTNLPNENVDSEYKPNHSDHFNNKSKNEDDDEAEEEYDYSKTMSYFNILSQNSEKDNKINKSKQMICDYSDEDSEGEKELNAANREQLQEHKAKLANAKDKLKQLQDLIVKLKTVSSSKSTDLTASQQHKLEQKEASAALELLNEIEKQKQQDRLDELKRNKQKLLELLKQKENESAELARLYTSHTSQKSLDDSKLNDGKPFSKSSDFVYPIELKNEFESAENDLEMMLNAKPSDNYQNIQSSHHSPSDLLWNQMKKQLNMRENLRSKKKELEDLIRDENQVDNVRTEKEPTENLDENDDNSNKIINGYRDFFLRNKSNCSVNLNKYSASKSNMEINKEEFESDEEEIIMKRYVPTISQSSKPSEVFLPEKKCIQQQNVCSTDELITNDYEKNYSSEEEKENEFDKKDDVSDEEAYYGEDNDEEFNSTIKGNKKEETDFENVFAKYAVNCEESERNSKINSDKKQENDQSKILNSLNMKFNDLLLYQQQLNDSIQRNFNQLLTQPNSSFLSQQQDENNRQANSFPSNNAYLMSSQFQFQTQMQVQQLMFNLNAAYHEIATQRSEMAQLNEQMKTINTRLVDLAKNKTTVSTGTNTLDANDSNRNESELKQRSSSSLITTTNALPSYFYNRRQTNNFSNENNTQNKNKSLYTRLNSNESDKKKYKTYQTTSSNEQPKSENEKFEYQTKRLNYLKQQQNTNSECFYSYENFLSKLEQENNSINKPAHNRHEVYYTDDFEECEEEDEDLENKAIISRPSSNASSTKTNRSVDTTTATNITVRTNSSVSSNLALKQSKQTGTPYWVEEDAAKNENNTQKLAYKNQNNTNECSSMSIQPNTGTIIYEGELFSFDRMREKIYSEVATLISQNEARPFFLLNLFRELQYLKDKNARDQALKSIFIINNRNQQLAQKEHDTNLKTLSKPPIFESLCNDLSLRAKIKQNNEENRSEMNRDDDDIVSYKYRMKKSENIYKDTDRNTDKKNGDDDASTSRTQSPFESDSLSNTVIFVKNSPQQNSKQALKIKYPAKKNEEIDFSRSSSSSIMGIQESNNVLTKQNQAMFEKFFVDQNKIEDEVKNFISKIIKSIKVSDNNSDYDEEYDEEYNDDEDDDYISLDEEIQNNSNTKSLSKPNSKNSYKYARCDTDYLNEIIDKVLNVLKQSSEHYDYLRLYQNQLSSYLKEALNKYENKRLIKCMEDILIDISDILYNELTFYSIMNNTNIKNPESAKNVQQSLKQNRMSRIVSNNIDIPHLKTENSSFCSKNINNNQLEQSKLNSSNVDQIISNNFNLNLIKSLARKNNQKLLEKKSFIEPCQNTKTSNNDEDECESSCASFQLKSNINTISSSQNISKTTSVTSSSNESRSISSSSSRTGRSSRTNSIDTAAASTNDETIYYFDENAVKTKLNCLKSKNTDLNSKIESNYSEILNRLKYILNEKSDELNSMMNSHSASNIEFEVAINNSKCLSEVKLSSSSSSMCEGILDVVRKESLEEANEDEIKIEDLPEKLAIPIEKEVVLNTLDQIIMESISDDLAGDAEALPSIDQPLDSVPTIDENPFETITNNIDDKNSEDENESQHSQKSENSDHFVMISETSNISSDDHDQIVIDEIKKSDEDRPEDQSVIMSENTTITELNETS